MIEFSKYERQKIAWRIKALCVGCPAFITYYDIKDSLIDNTKIKEYLLVKKNKDNLFLNEILSDALLNILQSMSFDIDLYDRRRIALIHGMIQYPLNHKDKIFDKNKFIDGLNDIIHSEERYELQYIFINSIISSISEEDDRINARKNLKMVSSLAEEGYEEDSLFSQFMELNSASTVVTKIPSGANYVAQGSTYIPSKEAALKLLFNFEAVDFQDIIWVGGYKNFATSYQMPLKKRIILEELGKLNELTFNESLDFLS
jgi:hypothetical protein